MDSNILPVVCMSKEYTQYLTGVTKYSRNLPPLLDGAELLLNQHGECRN